MARKQSKPLVILRHSERGGNLRVEAYDCNTVHVKIWGDTEYQLTPEQAISLRDKLTEAINVIKPATDYPNEEWRSVKGYELYYEVSNYGRVKSLRNGRILKGYISQGYHLVALTDQGKEKRFFVHILVAQEFLGERPDDHQVDHINRIKTDNRVENLRYLHYSINAAQGKLGLKQSSNDIPLTIDQRLEVRRLWDSRILGLQEIAGMFGVQGGVIRQVIRTHAKLVRTLNDNK